MMVNECIFNLLWGLGEEVFIAGDEVLVKRSTRQVPDPRRQLLVRRVREDDGRVPMNCAS